MVLYAQEDREAEADSRAQEVGEWDDGPDCE